MNPALPKTSVVVRKQIKNSNWHFIYLLESKVKDWIYIGCTNNLNKRLMEHKQGKMFSTRKMLPVELIYFEAYRSKDIAFEREKSLKKYGSALARLKSRIGITKKGRAG